MSKAGKGAEDVLSPEETVQVKLVYSGERERLKKLAKERLEQAGWTDELRQKCRDFAATCGPESVTHDAIVTEVRQQARAQVPDHIKAELLREIRTILEN